MKEYKVLSRTFYSKITVDKDHIAKSSQKEIQEILEDHTHEGWELMSTNAVSFGLAVYIYLYFVREKE